MLYRATPEGYVPWTGAAIGGDIHPLGIETAWRAEALAAIGLYAPAAADAVPSGQRVVSTNVRRVNDVVKFVHTLEDIPAPHPSDLGLTKRQLRLGLLANGILPSTIRATLESIPDAVERETALTWFEYTDLIQWDHPQTQAMMALAGFTEEQASAMWMAAWNIPA